MYKRRLALGILLAVCLAAAGWGIFALIRGNDTNQQSANGTVAPTFAGAATEAPAPMSAEDTPPIDILYLSHDHYDHMDYDTIMALDGRVSCYVVPNGMEEILAGWGIAPSKVHPMAPWEETVIAGIRAVQRKLGDGTYDAGAVHAGCFGREGCVDDSDSLGHVCSRDARLG